MNLGLIHARAAAKSHGMAFAHDLVRSKNPRVRALFDAFGAEADEDGLLPVGKITAVCRAHGLMDWSKSVLFDVEDTDSGPQLVAQGLPETVLQSGRIRMSEFVQWLWFTPQGSPADNDIEGGFLSENAVGKAFDSFDRGGGGCLSGADVLFLCLALNVAPWSAMQGLDNLQVGGTINREEFLQWWKGHNTLREKSKHVVGLAQSTAQWARGEADTIP
jgi:hypothetical protein